MDLDKVIQELNAEKVRLDGAIAALELVGSGKTLHGSAKRRGRKNMSQIERESVSDRMNAYWKRRQRAQVVA